MRSLRARVLPLVLSTLVVVAFGSVACKKDKTPEEVAADKRARCERVLATGVGMFTAVGVGVGEALSDGKADLSCLKANPTDPSQCMGPEEAAEYRKKTAEGVALCLAWPDEFLDCFEKLDFESARCEAAYRQFRGVVDSTPRAEGPAPLWDATLDHEPWGFAAADGTLLYAHEGGVTGLRDGKVVWSTPLQEPSGWLTPLAAGCVLAVDARGVACLGPADGAVRWRRDLPTEDASVAATAATDAGAIILLDDRHLVTVDAKGCAAGTDACATRVEVPWRLDDDASVTGLPGGLAAATLGSRLVLADADGAVRARLRAKDLLSEVVPAGTAVWVAYDRSIARLDPARCRTEEDATEELPGPCGTVVGSLDEDVDGYPPVPLGDDRVALTTEHLVVVLGPSPWKAEVDPTSRLFLGDGVLYAACAGEGGDEPPEVRAIATKDGATTWRTKLPMLPRAGFLDAPELHADAKTLYVTYKQHAVALPRR